MAILEDLLRDYDVRISRGCTLLSTRNLWISQENRRLRHRRTGRSRLRGLRDHQTERAVPSSQSKHWVHEHSNGR